MSLFLNDMILEPHSTSAYNGILPEGLPLRLSDVIGWERADLSQVFPELLDAGSVCGKTFDVF